MSIFRFQKFSVQQQKDVFRVGTDAVLLGALADLDHATSVVEVGVGTGIVSLMLAQRFPMTEILGLDINQDAVQLASENFRSSIYSDRLSAQCVDFKNYSSEVKIDAIVSNPPYFEINSSEKDVLARQKIELSFEALISASFRVLGVSGLFIVVIPKTEEDGFVKICSITGFGLKRKVSIKGIVTGAVKRVVLEFSKDYVGTCQLEELIIEKEARVYSQAYLELTRDFHVFNKKSI